MHHYTYLLIDEELGMNYIGVRSCKHNPSEDMYMGSSKHMDAECKSRCDKIVLNEFATREEAIADEIRMHELHDVARNEKFYNRAKQTSTGFDTCGTSLSDVHKAKISRKSIGNSSMSGMKHSEETKKKMSESQKGVSRLHTEESKDKIRNAKIGTKHKASSIEAISKAMKGRVITDEHRAKIKTANVGKHEVKAYCPHCDKVGNYAVMHRWHMDNCKYKGEVA